MRTTPDGSDLIFIMSDGSQHRVELNFSANGVDYDDSVTKFNVSNVQAAIEALFSELQAKQNTLTAGNGISIENDTISVTDAGGLTVLKNSDFPLSADLLAKVKANPQNYCIDDNGSICFNYTQSNGDWLYSSIPYRDSSNSLAFFAYDVVDSYDGRIASSSSGRVLPQISSETMLNTTTGLDVKGVRDKTDNSVKTGTQIRKAITIRKWH